MKETTGADFKSATDSENKKLFIETYGDVYKRQLLLLF